MSWNLLMHSIYTGYTCVVVLHIHDYTWLYTWLYNVVDMFVSVCLSMFVHSWLCDIVCTFKIPRISKSCQLHWACGQGTQAEEIGCSATGVGGICCTVNKSRHVHLLMISVRNTQKLWTFLTNSHFYTTNSSLSVSSMWLFKLTWLWNHEKRIEPPDLFFDTKTFLFFVSNHNIDFQWPLWALRAWGCTQQGQAVYVPGSVGELRQSLT